MYCSNCGNQIADGSKFCSFCGTKVNVEPVEEDLLSIDNLVSDVKSEEAIIEPLPDAVDGTDEFASLGTLDVLGVDETQTDMKQDADVATDEEAPSTSFAEFDWNVDEYPSRQHYEKTEDVNFDWNADPSTIVTGGGITPEVAAEIRVKADMMEEEEQKQDESPLGDFFTISKKNEEFQKLLNKEYEKVKAGNTIGDELSTAQQLADEMFDSRPIDNSMEAFLEREGLEKPYEPKEFETNVLEKIEAQEKAKERKRLEEEAREKALEEARQEALLKKQQEEARRKQQEEMEARAAKIRAEALAKEQAVADQRAAIEAEKIRKQKEARYAAVEEAKHRAEEERRRNEEQKLKSKLEAERQELTRKAETAAAAEEARKVLEHTTRMREEETAKIRAAIAGLRGELDKVTEHESVSVATSEPTPEPVHVEPVHVEPEVAEPEPVNLLFEDVKPVEHNYAKEDAVEIAEPLVTAETTDEPVIDVKSFEDLGFIDDEISGNTNPADTIGGTQRMPELEHAFKNQEPVKHTPVRPEIDEMARARDTYFATFYNDESLAEQMKAEANKPAVEAAIIDTNEEMEFVAPDVAEEVKPVTIDDIIATAPETLANESVSPKPKKDDLSGTRVIDKSAVLAGLETTRRISKAEIRAQEDKEFFETLESMPQDDVVSESDNAIDIKEPADTVDELINQFTTEMTPEETEQIAEGLVAKEEPAVMPNPAMANAERPGLSDTMVMPGKELEANMADEFESYGVEEAAKFKKQQEMAVADGVSDAVENIDQEEEFEDESESKGGIGRLILKIILIILIVIFVAELVGIGIKFIAPDSAIAAFIDNKLESIIHLITG